MVKQWVPLKIKWYLDVFIRVPSHKFYSLLDYQGYIIGILGESLEIQFLALFYIYIYRFYKGIKSNLKSSLFI